MSSSSTPTTTRLCASCATVEANAPARSPKPRTSPTPTGPVAWWRSTTAILARSRSGSATTRPSCTAGSSSRACVISWPGIVSITRTRAAAGIASASRETGAARMVLRTRSGIRGRANGSARPPAATCTPSLYTRAGRKVSRSSRRSRSARAPGATAPRSSSRWQRAGCSVAIRSAVLGRDPLAHRDPAHLVDVALAVQEVGLAVVGAEGAVLRPVPRHQRQQVAQVARVRRLAQQHPHAAPPLLERLLERGRLVVGADAGGDVGVERMPGDARGVPVDVLGASSSRASTSGSPAMTPGKFIISATPERPRVAQDRLACRPARAARTGDSKCARRHARRRHHEHVERQPLGRARAASRRPRRPSTLAISCGSADDRRRPVRHDRPRELRRGQLRGLDVHVRVDEPGHQEPPAGVDPLAAVVGAEPGDPAAGDRHVAVQPLAGEDGEHARARDHEVRSAVAARDRDQPFPTRLRRRFQRREPVAASPGHRPTMSSGRTGTRGQRAPGRRAQRGDDRRGRGDRRRLADPAQPVRRVRVGRARARRARPAACRARSGSGSR